MIFDARDLIAFPGGANSSDTVLAGIHFNLTTLEHFNYTLYSNGTLSNGSKCMLVFEPWEPKLLYPNGTFINATSCYSPVNPIGLRAKIGIGFAVAFGFLLMGTIMALRKHGRLFLPAERRFRPIGRRWQWYWGILTAVAAIISLFMNIDVDRYYLPELPIVLTSFFWYLLQMCTVALVWEAIRHWGSWQERQYIDPNPFILSQDDRRAMFEFFIPLVFYLFLWLNFFMIVPRSWGRIEKQRDDAQTDRYAAPTATGIRPKIAAFFLLASWLITVGSLRHSIKNYMPRNRGIVNRLIGFVGATPPRFVLLLIFSLAMIAYQALCAWEFQWSVLKVKGDRAAIYLGGYLPSLLILLVQIVYGWISPNEDRELIRQRRERGVETDRDLGLVKKPAWWRRLNPDYVAGGESMRDRIARNVNEIGGGRATTRGIDTSLANRAYEVEAQQNQGLEMNSLARTASNATARSGYGAGVESYNGKSDRRRTEHTMAVAAGMLFPSEAATPTAAERRLELMVDGPPPPYNPSGDSQARGRSRQGGDRPGSNERSTSTGTTGSLSGAPQQVKSMLDV